MNESIIERSDLYVDSREVAKLIDKPHSALIKIINKNIAYFTSRNVPVNDFFIENTSIDMAGQNHKYFMITKGGCEVIANKLMGKRKALFTASIVKSFGDQEFVEQARFAYTTADEQIQENSINEFNMYTKFIVTAMKVLGATHDQLAKFFKSASLTVNQTEISKEQCSGNNWYIAYDIAKICGLYSINGYPHSWAVSSILNDIILIGDEHMNVRTFPYGNRMAESIQYDQYALSRVMKWLVDNDLPTDIYGSYYTYHVKYRPATRI